MDGASYHKRNMNPAPTTSWLKSNMQGWLTQNSTLLYHVVLYYNRVLIYVMYLDVQYDIKDTKAKLMGLVRANKSGPDYRACQIAREHGHTVSYTPPYHPELQPIELIWAMMKNRIAMDPARSMADLLAKVQEGFLSITGKNWVSVFRHAQKFEDKYDVLCDAAPHIGDRAEGSELDVSSDDADDEASGIDSDSEVDE